MTDTQQIDPTKGLVAKFNGLPQVLNDGVTENTLSIYLMNNNFFVDINDDDHNILFSTNSTIYLWLPVSDLNGTDEKERPWALMSESSFDKPTVNAQVYGQDWNCEKITLGHSEIPGRKELRGWKITPNVNFTLRSGESLAIVLDGIISDLPDGPSPFMVIVENINDKKSANFNLEPVIKSSVVLNSANGHVGIGMIHPESTLSIKGDVYADGLFKDKNGYVVPIGTIVAYCSASPPKGWLLCDGASLKILDFPELASFLPHEAAHLSQNPFGIKKVQGPFGIPIPELTFTTPEFVPSDFFKVPDLRARFIVGAGGPNDDYQHGKTGGVESVTLKYGEMPEHRHGFMYSGSKYANEGWIPDMSTDRAWGLKVSDREVHGMQLSPSESSNTDDKRKQTIRTAGETQPHENRPPYYGLTYIIKC